MSSDESEMLSDPHPRPQLERSGWISLNGEWDFALDIDNRWCCTNDVIWDKKIRVPFAPETPASGVAFTGYFHACWYRRQFRTPALEGGRRLIIHFGAI